MDNTVDERHGLDPSALPDDVLQSTEPLVLRGLVSSWPAVAAARRSNREVVDYLRQFDAKRPIIFLTAPPKAKGRFFYNEDLSGFNFTRHRGPLGATLEQILNASGTDSPSIYMGSTMLDPFLPGFREQNPLNLEAQQQKLANIWVGNRTRIAAHQDLPKNLACIVAGRRRFTLFPPEQLANLYIGPLDFNPAGQAISLVDFHQPDHDRFPRFRDAMAHARVVDLEPGDVLMIPSMWWHHVEGLDPFNVLVNYWWRDQPAYLNSPFNAMMLAMLAIRDLPPDQRRTWQENFRHYVFEAGEATHGHIPESARGVLAPMDEQRARDMCKQLMQRISP